MGSQFEGKKVIVVGGSAGMGRQTALDIVARGGTAVIVGRDKARVDDTVADLTMGDGSASGVVAELTDRDAVTNLQRELSENHGDATLLVNAAGFFIPSRSSTMTLPSTTRSKISTTRCSSSPRPSSPG